MLIPHRPALSSGAEYFNRKEFTVARDLWEREWHIRKGDESKLYEGLTCIAQGCLQLYKASAPRALVNILRGNQMLFVVRKHQLPFNVIQFGKSVQNLTNYIKEWSRSEGVPFDNAMIPTLEISHRQSPLVDVVPL